MYFVLLTKILASSLLINLIPDEKYLNIKDMQLIYIQIAFTLIFIDVDENIQDTIKF